MKATLVYDSAYGNTEKVALAIGRAIAGDVATRRVKDAPSSLAGIDLLVVGSPTQGGRPTAAIQAWIDGLPQAALANTRVAAFDTRVAKDEQGFGLRLLIGFIGYAAPRIADGLRAKGGLLAAAPEGFIVGGKEGPLKNGELERAVRWAHDLQLAAAA